MKERWETPQVIIFLFKDEDIITTSGDTGRLNNGGENGGISDETSWGSIF